MNRPMEELDYKTHPYSECFDNDCDECERYYCEDIHPDFCDSACEQPCWLCSCEECLKLRKEGELEMEYTQGPWEFRQTRIDDSAFISDIHAPHQDNPRKNGTNPAVATTWHRPSQGEDEANARLISAAPELFEAIKEVVSAFESYCDDWNSTQPTDVTVCLPQLKIAMAKAVGIKEYFEEY